MGVQEFEEAMDLIRENAEEVDGDPQPEARVARAEAALGVRFPDSYRRMLLELGAPTIGSAEVYGVFNDDLDDHRPPQMVGLTRRMRREGAISDSMIVVHGVGDGSFYGLDTTGGDDAPVLSFTPGQDRAGDDLETAAGDFGEFLLELAREELE